MKRTVAFIVGSVVLSLTTASPAVGAWTEFDRLLPPTTPYQTYFGRGGLNGVDVLGDRAIVGQPVYSSGYGTAYIFDVARGHIVNTLTVPGLTAGDPFGFSVALTANTATVTARNRQAVEDDLGAAYQFDLATGDLLHTMAPSDVAPGETIDFGEALDVNDDWTVVGAPEDDDNGGNSGSVYIFDTHSGDFRHKLTAFDGGPNDRFGDSVAVDGDIAVIGADLSYEGGVRSGSAYVYDLATGDLRWKLTPPSLVSGDEFGSSVAISGDRIIIGSAGHDSGTGTAYVFDTVSGSMLRELTASDPIPNAQFGCSVAISEGVALVGAEGRDDIPPHSGGAYLFGVESGAQLQKLTASDMRGTSEFGSPSQ